MRSGSRCSYRNRRPKIDQAVACTEEEKDEEKGEENGEDEDTTTRTEMLATRCEIADRCSLLPRLAPF